MVSMSALILGPVCPGLFAGGWSSHGELRDVWSILHLKPAKPQPLHGRLTQLTGAEEDWRKEGGSLGGLVRTLSFSVLSSLGDSEVARFWQKRQNPFWAQPRQKRPK